jgi:hypothetical protein
MNTTASEVGERLYTKARGKEDRIQKKGREIE